MQFEAKKVRHLNAAVSCLATQHDKGITKSSMIMRSLAKVKEMRKILKLARRIDMLKTKPDNHVL